jgi:hypothetical protein
LDKVLDHFHARGAAVDGQHVFRQFPAALERLDRAHAGTLVGEDDVADAENDCAHGIRSKKKGAGDSAGPSMLPAIRPPLP